MIGNGPVKSQGTHSCRLKERCAFRGRPVGEARILHWESRALSVAVVLVLTVVFLAVFRLAWKVVTL